MNYTEKLAKTILLAGGICLTAGLIWYFGNVVAYIAIAGIVALIAKHIMNVLKKIRIRNWHFPDWILTIVTMLFLYGMAGFIILKIFPILGNTLGDIASLDLQSVTTSLNVYVHEFNSWVTGHFSAPGESFNIQSVVTGWIQKLLSLDLLTSVTGSVANFMMDLGIGLFCVIFISFFFIKDSDLLSNLITSLVPDEYEQGTKEAIRDIEHLLSRYFGGITVEITGITLLNFIGLHFIAGLGSDLSLTIAAITGIFNIIPYIGPLAGGALGTVIGLVSKIIYSSTTMGDMSLWGFTLLLVGIFVVTHLVDVFVFQPFIYSSSIKANALEIFIVILMAGTIGGPVGMLVAVPAYTVIRVIAIKFFGDKKAIRVLMKQ